MPGVVSGATIDFIDLTGSSPRRSPHALPDDMPEIVAGPSRPRSKPASSGPLSPLDVSEDVFPGENDSPINKKKRRRERKRKDTENAASAGDENAIFFLDAEPIERKQPDEAESTTEGYRDNTLSLPEHVTVTNVNVPPNVILASESMNDAEDDFIHFADADTTSFARYFDEPRDLAVSKLHVVCGHCGAEGEHKSSDCTVLVCLTCGAHNEHATRQCPIIKVCFACGLKGHTQRDCPNRFSRRVNVEEECERCGSDAHKALECPTLWRIYKYHSQNERAARLQARDDAIASQDDQEQYIGQGFYCYYCGEEGHLGDDCADRPSRLREFSAFSLANVQTGPFSEDITIAKLKAPKVKLENKNMFDDGHGFSAPTNVGRKGREKERERLKKHEKKRDPSNDEDDWFARGNRRTSGNKKPERERRNKDSRDDRRNDRISFNFSNKNQDRQRTASKLETRISIPSRESRQPLEQQIDRGPRFDDWKREREYGQERHLSSWDQRGDVQSRRQYFGGYGQ